MDKVEIKIVIPSHLRADNVITKYAVDNAIICVPESQKEEYENHNIGSEVVAHPDSIKGLTMKRQWIYEKFKNVLMLDDDVMCIRKLYTEIGESEKMQPDEVYEVIQYIGNIAKLMGVYLFGLNKNAIPATYQELKPFQMTGLVNGGALGMLEGSKLEFNPEGTVVEDYQISCDNAYYHRKCLVDLRFAPVYKNTFMNKGGCSQYRTKEIEKQDTLWLRKKYGEVIDLKKDTVLSKRKHEYMRTLNVPF
jgi:hypothetical protein